MNPNIEDAFAEVANVIYDDKGVDLIMQFAKNAKEPAIGAAMLAATLMLKIAPKLEGLSEEDMWGPEGLLHSILDAIFEVMKHTGANLKLDLQSRNADLEKAYTTAEQIYEQGLAGKGQMQQPQGQPMQGQQQPPMQPPQGSMPAGGIFAGGAS